jgi:hypothetical protein
MKSLRGSRTEPHAERLFQFPRIGNLSEPDARRALAEPARDEGVLFVDDALGRSVDITGGYPYFLQELGFAVWGVAEGDTITETDVEEALPLYEAKLDSSFFRVRLDRCTEKQNDLSPRHVRAGPGAAEGSRRRG